MIPSQIKQAWAAQLKVLFAIDEICKRHDIKYFADWGTLIGTVRHGGYIPWDDDLDICMKREDLEKFMQYADEELPKEYSIHNYRRKEDHWLFITKIVNHSHICYEPEHLRKYDGFPYLACVDIFVLDYMYRDEEQENERKKIILRTLAIADGIVEGRYTVSKMEAEILEIEKRIGSPIKRLADRNAMGIELYAAAEEMFKEVKEEDADNITQIFPFGLKENNHLVFPKEYFSDAIMLPFEDREMPVPLAFDVVLKRKYGPYLSVNKGGGAHGYPYFEGQKEDFFRHLDFELPSYKYEKKSLQQADKNCKKPYIEQARIYVEEMNKLCEEYNRVYTEDVNDSISVLASIQEYAVALGGLLESVKGEGSSCISNAITILENICEYVYELGLQINEGKTNKINDDFIGNISNEIVKLESRQDVVFLSRTASEWKYMNSYYEEYLADNDCDVIVIPLSRFRKDYDGTLIDEQSDASEYLESLRLVSWESYDIKMACPDVVYINDAYDEWHPIYSVPPMYYSKEIMNYTNKLVYISSYEIDGFEEKDEREWYNSQHYISMPGVVNADEIVVCSEDAKNAYANVLCHFAQGDISEEQYLNIISINKCKLNEDNNAENLEEERIEKKKKLLVALSMGNLIENKEKQLEKVKYIEQVLSDNKDKIEIGWMIFPNKLPESVENKYRDIVEAYRGLVSNYELEGIGIDISDKDKDVILREYDAYYGDPTYLVHEFVRAHKPVMISNVEIM